MAYQVIWSPEAIEDVDKIAEYIQKDSPAYAHSVVESMVTKSRELDNFPLRGRLVPELKNESFREVFVYSYRMIYHVNEEASVVSIAAVIHGARLLSERRFECR